VKGDNAYDIYEVICFWHQVYSFIIFCKKGWNNHVLYMCYHFFTHVMSVCSGAVMVGIVRTVVLSVTVCVDTHIGKACAASINMVTESRVRNAA